MNDKMYIVRLGWIPTRIFSDPEDAKAFIALKKTTFKTDQEWSIHSVYLGLTEDEKTDIRGMQYEQG